jgi:hypothetical protein
LIEVKTQAQLDKALKKTNGGVDDFVVLCGDGPFVFTGQSSPRVVTWGQSSPRVVTREQSSPRVVTREQSSPRVETWEQSSPRVVTREQSSPRVVTREQSSPRVETWEQSSLTGSIASSSRPIFERHESSRIKIRGAVILDPPKIDTPAEWCDYYGVEIRKGGNLTRKLAGEDVAILFKALPVDLRARGNFQYVLGETPIAPDWDGGKRECGGGLHFSPTPGHAEEFGGSEGRYIACPVLVSDLAVHPDGIYPQKVKAPGCCAPIWEVDADGERIETSAEASA